MNRNPIFKASDTLITGLSLFTSIGTLMCCALPALLVTLGLGASLAGIIGAAPWITSVSDYKIPIFVISGILLIISSIIVLRARRLPCPIDPKQAIVCKRLRKFNVITTVLAWSIYITGFFFAFLAVHLFY